MTEQEGKYFAPKYDQTIKLAVVRVFRMVVMFVAVAVATLRLCPPCFSTSHKKSRRGPTVDVTFCGLFQYIGSVSIGMPFEVVENSKPIALSSPTNKTVCGSVGCVASKLEISVIRCIIAWTQHTAQENRTLKFQDKHCAPRMFPMYVFHIHAYHSSLCLGTCHRCYPPRTIRETTEVTLGRKP